MVDSLLAKRLRLHLLRATTGFLLVGFGLDKIVSGIVPLIVRRNVGPSDVAGQIVGLATFLAELLIGPLCVVGFCRFVVVSRQALINGATAVSGW